MIARSFRLVLISIAIAALNGRPGSAQSPVTPTRDPNIIAEYDFDAQSRAGILVPVKLGDRSYLFAVDTGASLIAFDSTLKSLLGPVHETSTMRTVSGYITIETFKAPQAFLGSVSLQTPEPVCCVDLSAVRKASGSEIFGLIGMSLLKNHVMALDFNRHKLRFLKEARTGMGISKQTISFEKDRVVPFVELDLPRLGQRSFMVDTGFNLSLKINETDFAELLRWQEIRSVESLKITDLGGSRIVKNGTLSRVQFKDFFFEQIRVSQNDMSTNLVGLQLLRGFDCTFDFPANALYLSKKTRTASDGQE